LIARFALHERISLMRWMGIALVSSGVGFVTTGPEITKRPPKSNSFGDRPAQEHS
jgi:drug/metabolite transporter (DMT)-like permease